MRSYLLKLSPAFYLALLVGALALWSWLEPASSAYSMPLVFGAVRVLKDPATAVKDMIAGLESSKEKYKDGVLNPRVDVKKATLDAAEFHKAQTKKALDEDRWKKRMEKVDYDAAAQTASASADQLVDGVKKREAKVLGRVTKYFGLLRPHVERMNAVVVKSEADADKKVLDNLHAMREIGRKMKSE